MAHLALPEAVSQSAFPVDPDFPQLEIATDPTRMLDVFRAHLAPLAGRDCRIESCVPVRFRCRQSTTRCVLQYVLRVVEPATERRWDQWATGVLYAEPGAAAGIWREMAADNRRRIPEHWRTFEPVTFI